MKKLSKKLLTVLLALVLVVSVATVAALASGATPATTAEDLAKAIAPSGDDYDHNKVEVTGNKVTLKGNIESGTVKGDIAINGGTGANELTLDLGSYTLTLGDSQDGRGGTWNNEIALLKGAKLKITGTSGIVTTKGPYSTIAIYGGSSLTVDKGVTIKNEYTNHQDEDGNTTGIAISASLSERNPGGGKITINGATVEGQRGISIDAENSSLTVENGSTITGLASSGILAMNDAKVTVKGGTIKGAPYGIIAGGLDPKTKKNSSGHLTVTGGTIESTDKAAGAGIYAYHESTAIISGGKVSGHTGVTAWDGATIEIKDSADIDGTEIGVDSYGFPEEGGTGKPAVVTISGGTVDGRYGVLAYNGGQMNVSGGTIHGTAAGIGTNGSDPKETTKITVTGGNISGDIAGAYMPAGTLEVSGKDTSIKGQAGIVVRGGEVKVSGGTVEATSKDTVTIGDAKGTDGNTYTVPAAAITVDIGAKYPQQGGGQKHVTIMGGTVKAPENGKSIVACENSKEVTDEGDRVSKSPFDITDGKFVTVDGAGSETFDDNQVNKYLPSNYNYSDEGKLTNSVTEDTLVATVNGIQFTDLAEAIKHAEGGKTVVLKKNVDLTDPNAIDITFKVTLDLGNYKITKAATAQDDTPIFKVTGKGAELTIIGTGSIEGTSRILSVENEGKAILSSGSIISTDKAGTTDKNTVAVKVEGKGSVTVEKDFTITSDDTAIGVFGESKLTVNGGKIATKNEFAIGTNGATGASNDMSEIVINDGDISSTNNAGVYLPNGKLTVKGGDISGAAGIVVRGGTATVEDGNVTANGTTNVAVGAPATTPVPPAAVVVDNAGYSGGNKAILEDGTFKANGNNAAVVYSENGEDKSSSASGNPITVKGGKYSSKVDDKLLDTSLKAGIKDSNNLYSYYESKADALTAVPDGEPFLTTEGEKVASMDEFEFGENKAELNIVIPSEVTGVEQKYTIKVYAGTTASGKTVAEMTTDKALKAGDKYTFDLSELLGGVYTIKLYNASNTDVNTATITFYKVTYKASTGVTGEDEYFCSTVKAEFEAKKGKEYVPSTFTLNGDVNKWNFGYETNGTYNYTVTIGGVYASPVDPGHKCPTKGFKDMEILDTSKLWYHEAMDYMVTNGYINGFEDNTLQPNGTATRAQMWVIMAQTKGAAVAGNPWYKAAAEWAVKHEYSDGLRPNDYIQREEIVAILWRMADEPKSTQSLSKYSDAASVNDWAKTAMAWAVEKGIISGRTDANGKAVLVPQGIATRAELAVLIYNYVTLMK